MTRSVEHLSKNREEPILPASLLIPSDRESTKKGRPLRVAHLVSHPIQYFAPLYRELSSRPEIDLTVYFYSGVSLGEYFDTGFGRNVTWDIPLTAGFKYQLAPEDMRRSIADGFDWRPNIRILRDLLHEKYDIIWLHGYMFINAWLALAIGAVTGNTILLRDEQTLDTPRSLVKRLLKQLALPIMFSNVWGLPTGKSNRAFFEAYGTKKISPVSYGVDNQSLRTRFFQLKPDRELLRKRLGISSDGPVILFSGKLIDKKRPQLLLEAFQRVRRERPSNLLFVGDGQLRSFLEAQVREQLIPNVFFTGFLNQSELPSAYAAADIFVLPSAYQETWGLVVNEAMNFNLPLVLSDRVGCARDLVEEGQNGFVFRSGDVGALTAALLKLVRSPATRTQFGERSAEIIAGYSVRRIADQFIAACLSGAGVSGSFRSTEAGCSS